MTKFEIDFEKRATRYSANKEVRAGLGTYWTSKANKQALQKFATAPEPMWKTAAIGGEQESGFEKAFGSLAYAYLKDKTPRLLDYIVGFQLVDRNQDNTKAVGIFGFKVGEQWLYCPTFFLNGDLKGHELLYMKKQDAFVPMKENWVNYIISRKPHILGDSSEKTTQQLGVVPPDLSRFTRPPSSSKYASDVQAWADPFIEFISACQEKVAASLYGKRAPVDTFFALEKVASAPTAAALAGIDMNLGEFLGQDIELIKAAYELNCAYPLIRKGIETFYGNDFFVKTAEELKTKKMNLLDASMPTEIKPKEAPRSSDLLPPVPSKPKGTVKVKYKSALDDDAPGGLLDEMTEEERDKINREGILIDDKRNPEEKSVAYNTQVAVELQNPGETGIYQVLERPGTFSRMLVSTRPASNNGNSKFTTVVRLEDTRSWANIPTHRVFVKSDQAPNKQEYSDWFEGLPKVGDGLTGEIMLVGPSGATTLPFRVSEKLGDNLYEINLRDYVSSYGVDNFLGNSLYGEGYHRIGSTRDYSSYGVRLRINTRPGTSIRSSGHEITVPDNFRVLRLEKLEEKEEEEYTSSISILSCCSSSMSRSDPVKPIMPGNIVDIQTTIHEKTSALKIFDQGSEVVIRSERFGDERLLKLAALGSLVVRHGLDEEAARAMLTEAGRKKTASYRIKYAFSNQMMPGPGAPDMPDPLTGVEQVGRSTVSATYPQEETRIVPELQASNTNPQIYDPFYEPDKGAVQTAQRAAQSGQKEIFDTAMVSSMLKAVRQDSMVDRYLGKLMSALDALGRVLFMFYWHGEEFEERYGKQDLPELEDSLRNSFEMLGDVCLFLKEKQVGDLDELQGVGSPNVDQAARN